MITKIKCLKSGTDMNHRAISWMCSL